MVLNVVIASIILVSIERSDALPYTMKLFYPGHPAELKVDDAQKNAVSSWSLTTLIDHAAT
jgi:hypothetical protein